MIGFLLAALVGCGAPAVEGQEAARPPQAQGAAIKSDKPVKKAKKAREGKKDGKNEAKEAADVASPDEPLDRSEQIDTGAGRAPARFVWKQHPSLRFGKVLRLDFEAKLQEDGRTSYEGARQTASLDPLEFHRNRIGVQGTFVKHIEFEIERELTERELTERELAENLTPASPWKDVYVNVDYIDNAQIQGGKFKVPFSLDQMIGVTHNDFVYRSLGAIYLAPARDIGLMVHGRFFKRGLNYWAGTFRHDGDNARSKKIQGGDRTFAARVTARPLRAVAPAWFESLEVGGAIAETQVGDDSFRPNGLRGRSVVTQDTFYEPVYVKGQRWRWEADVDWTKGPVSARAEYTHVTDQRLGQGFGDQDLPNARHRAWYVTGTWLLTGETKTRPVKPAHDFLRGGIGAVEVAARYERLWFDSVGGSDVAFANPRAETILPSGDRVLTLGVNWTLNRFLKLQANALREQIQNPDRNPAPNGAAFWSRVLRLQFVL